VKLLGATMIMAVFVLCGCGDGGSGGEPTQPEASESEGRQLTGAGADRGRFIGESGTATKTACELVGLATVERIVGVEKGTVREPLERSANDSLDLSFCEFRERSGKEIFVRIGLDTATRAVRRYYNLITEARQLPNILDPAKENRLQLVRGVGDDGTYGGAGAFWIPSRLDLTSIKDERIVRVHFYVPGTPNGRAKRAAAELAKRAFAGYD
jgi:hypothetical protein